MFAARLQSQAEARLVKKDDGDGQQYEADNQEHIHGEAADLEDERRVVVA